MGNVSWGRDNVDNDDKFFFSPDTKHQHQLKLGDEIKLSKMYFFKRRHFYK